MNIMNSIKHNSNTLVNSKWYYWFLALLSFIFVLLFSRATSPLYAYVGYDAAIFKQMGMAILKGKTIYLDYFDNKGCLLYFIQALCIWLGGDFVILVFQAISLTITLIMLDKIISLYKDGANRLFVLLLGLVLLLCFYEGGDLSEEWSLPFICCPLYKFLKSYKEDKSLNAKDLYLIGLCFGVIAFIRINNAVPFCGFLLCLFVGYLLKKQWREFIINALAFAGGVVTIAIPCFLYFYLKAGSDGVYWMVYATFLSGFEYLGVNVKMPIIVIVCYYLIILVFLIIHLISLKGNPTMMTPVIISYLLFIMAFGTKCFEHYQIIMLPIYVMALSSLDIKNRNLRIILSLLLILLAFGYLIRPIGFIVVKSNDKANYLKFHDIMKKIPQIERDSIHNYNTDVVGYGLLYNEGISQCNYISLSPFSLGMNSLYSRKRLLSEDKPLWVMICHDVVIPEDMRYLQKNYEERFVLHYDSRYLKNVGGFGIEKDIYFFRRKD